MDPQHYYEDLAAFALNALDPDERKVVEAHLSVCITCRVAAEEARCVAEQLAFGAPLIVPPPVLKQRLLDRIAAEQPAPRRSTIQRSWRALAAISAAVIVLMLIWNLQMQSRVSALRQEQAQLSDQLRVGYSMLALSDTVARSLVGTANAPQAAGKLYMRPDSQQAMLVVSGLKPLPPGKVYQCWLVRNRSTFPVASFQVTDWGPVGLVIESRDRLQNYSLLMITIEPASGASQPGNDTVLAGNLF